MTTKRLPTLPFLPSVPSSVTPKYASDLNLAINLLYRNIAQSVDEVVVTATASTDFPAAKGFKRFGYDGSKLYIDWNATSWTPVASYGTVQQSLMVLPDGLDRSVVAGAGPGNGVPIYLPFFVGGTLNFSSLDAFFSLGQATAVGSSQGRSISLRAAILNTADPMVVQATASTNITWLVTGATQSGTAVKRAVLPWTTSLTPGHYVLGLWSSSSSSGNALALTQSQILTPVPGAFTFKGDIQSTTFANSNQMLRFYAVGSVSNTGFSAASSVQASDLVGTQGSQQFPMLYIRGIGTV